MTGKRQFGKMRCLLEMAGLELWYIPESSVIKFKSMKILCGQDIRAKKNVSIVWEKIEEIRSLVKARDYITATEKASESMFGLSSDGYVPYGSLYIDPVTENKNVTDYRRELDLEEGIERCSYKVNDILIKRSPLFR